MIRFRSLLAGALACVLAAQPVLAAGFLTNGLPPAGGTQYPSTIPLTGNEAFPADTNLPSGLNPASEAVTASQLLTYTQNPGNWRNFASNGAMLVNQQGTGIITGGQTSITALQFAADRWFLDANVSSGAARGQVATATPTPPTGFINELKVYRTSGALTQPVCTLQELASSRSYPLAGQNVVLSASLQALAGLSSASKAVTMYVITGTGAEQGLGTLTASPAITPAWTGIATAGQATANLSSTSWGRFYTGSIAIPATATEVGIEVCFTPGATGSGTTDGFAMTGVQLEVVGAGVTGPSAFEQHVYGQDLADAERYFWQLNEPASGAAVNGMCQALTANTNTCTVNLPQTFRGTVPVIAIGTAGTFKVNIANTVTTFATPTAGVCSIYSCTVTGANTNTAGQAEQLTGGGSTGVWTVNSDVVF